jgi:hypothetical protein
MSAPLEDAHLQAIARQVAADLLAAAPPRQQQAEWTCVAPDGRPAGDVKIWWGYTPADAAWACTNWVPACGNAPAPGCSAVPAGGAAAPPRPVARTTTTTTAAPPRPVAAVSFAGRVYRAGDPELRASGQVAPVVTRSGRPAYEITYQKGVIHGRGSNMNALLAPAAHFPADQCRLRVKLFYEPGFPWGARMPKAGGKIIGFEIGRGAASGGNYSPTGASLRVTWSYNGGVGPYLYPQVRAPLSKKQTGVNADWAALDQSEPVRNVSYIATGVHMFYPAAKDRKRPEAWDLRLREGVWNDVELFVKLNTPGRHDGVVELTVNGVTKRSTDVRYRYDDAKIMGVRLHSFFGGGSQDYAPTHTARAWYADFGFSAT